MQVTAQLKNLRIAPRKVRLISDLIKGLDAAAAKSQLDHLIKKSSGPISKLLDSALANAHNNFGLVKENLFIKNIVVDEGMKLKRFRPKGFGSTSPILKRSSRIKMILEEKVPGLKLTEQQIKEHKKAEEAVPEKAEPTVKEEKVKTAAPKPEAKKGIGKKGLFGKISKRFFRRKAI
ncbi:MAG: 50S ribosomal protein L22 [Patescibacteria group bacterium]